MFKFILVLLLLIPNSSWAKRWIPVPYNGSIYLKQPTCPGTCIEINDNVEPRALVFQGGVWVEDAALKTSILANDNTNIANEIAIETSRKNRIDSAKLGIKNAINFIQLKQALVDYMGL